MSSLQRRQGAAGQQHGQRSVTAELKRLKTTRAGIRAQAGGSGAGIFGEHGGDGLGKARGWLQLLLLSIFFFFFSSFLEQLGAGSCCNGGSKNMGSSYFD